VTEDKEGLPKKRQIYPPQFQKFDAVTGFEKKSGKKEKANPDFG